MPSPDKAPERMAGRDFAVAAPSLGRRLLHWTWALVLLSLLGGGGYLLLHWEPRHLPVQVVTVTGTLEHLSAHQLRQTVTAHLDGGVLTLDLERIKTAVEAMPWVRSASLRRQWPDRLELEVVERVALARWGEDALIGPDSTIFRPDAAAIPPGLPQLAGAERNASTLVQRLLEWGARLRVLALEIETLALDARGAWTLRLSTGCRLDLGKKRVEERLVRFIGVYPALVAAGTPTLVDMRYSNGLAVRWAETEDTGTGDAGTGDTGTGGVGPGLEAPRAVRSAAVKSRLSGPARS